MSVFAWPFVWAWHLLVMFFWLPVVWQVVLVLALVASIFLSGLKEAGPLRIASLARRFSWSGIILGLILLLWLWMAIVPTVLDNLSYWYAFYSGLQFLASIGIVWYFQKVWRRDHTKGCLRRAYARMRLRLRWDSIAKSCGLSHMKDVRPHDWGTGGTATTVLAIRVQWVPTLWHGRRSMAGDSTDYLFRPARGFDTSKVQDTLAALAIAVLAHSVTLNESPFQNWWTMTVYWSDPASMRPDLDWIDADSKVAP